MAPPAVPSRAILFPSPYKSRRVLHLRNSCQVAGGGWVLWKSHLACSFPLEFSSGSPPTLELLCGCAVSWHCFLSVKSLNNKQQLGLGVSFHLHWPPLGVFGISLPILIFKFHTASARTPPKIKFLNLWVAAKGVHRNSLAKSAIFFGISLAHMTGRKALAAYLDLFF